MSLCAVSDKKVIVKVFAYKASREGILEGILLVDVFSASKTFETPRIVNLMIHYSNEFPATDRVDWDTGSERLWFG